MKKAVIALTLLALVLLTGCSTQVVDAPEAPAVIEPETTPDQAVGEVDQLLIDEAEELDIGEML